MRVAAFQFDVRRGDVTANLAAVEEGLAAAAREDVRVVVLPEMWPTSFDPDPDLAASDAALGRVRELSGELGLVVCGSAFAAAPEGAPGARPRNRLHVLVEGRAAPGYDKVHLFSPTAERELFSAGEDPPPVVETPAARLAGVVCYDLRFGPLVNVVVEAGAEVLVCPAQWPAARATHWEALLRGRAVEAQALVVGANRTGSEPVGRGGRVLEFAGNSLVVGPDGSVLAEGRGQAGLVVGECAVEAVRELRKRVPVARDRRPGVYGRWRGR